MGPTLTTEGKPCILPFTYEEYSGQTLTFDSCTTHNYGNIKWCATAVDDQGRYREGDGDFGICDEPKCKGKNEKTKKRGFTNYLPRGLNFLKKEKFEKIQKITKKEIFLKNFGFFFKILKNK